MQAEAVLYSKECNKVLTFCMTKNNNVIGQQCYSFAMDFCQRDGRFVTH